MMGRLQGKRMLCAIFDLKSWTPPYLFAPNSKGEGLQHIIERKKEMQSIEIPIPQGKKQRQRHCFLKKNFDEIIFFP